jgi:acyl-CoA hydrolase
MTTSDRAGPRETSIVEMVFPNQTNHYGTLFAGDALRLMDMAAFVTASRHARRPVVTASSERIDFHVPATGAACRSRWACHGHRQNFTHGRSGTVG